MNDHTYLGKYGWARTGRVPSLAYHVDDNAHQRFHLWRCDQRSLLGRISYPLSSVSVCGVSDNPIKVRNSSHIDVLTAASPSHLIMASPPGKRNNLGTDLCTQAKGHLLTNFRTYVQP